MELWNLLINLVLSFVVDTLPLGGVSGGEVHTGFERLYISLWHNDTVYLYQGTEHCFDRIFTQNVWATSQLDDTLFYLAYTQGNDLKFRQYINGVLVNEIELSVPDSVRKLFLTNDRNIHQYSTPTIYLIVSTSSGIYLYYSTDLGASFYSSSTPIDTSLIGTLFWLPYQRYGDGVYLIYVRLRDSALIIRKGTYPGANLDPPVYVEAPVIPDDRISAVARYDTVIIAYERRTLSSQSDRDLYFAVSYNESATFSINYISAGSEDEFSPYLYLSNDTLYIFYLFQQTGSYELKKSIVESPYNTSPSLFLTIANPPLNSSLNASFVDSKRAFLFYGTTYTLLMHNYPSLVSEKLISSQGVKIKKGIFTIDGRRVQRLNRSGLYFMIENGKVRRKIWLK